MVSRVSLKIGQFTLFGYSYSEYIVLLSECVLPINCKIGIENLTNYLSLYKCILLI